MEPDLESKAEKRRRALGLFIESVYKPDPKAPPMCSQSVVLPRVVRVQRRNPSVSVL